MQPVTFTPDHFLFGKTPAYLLSGEFHYFRVPKKDWLKRMTLFKEAGGNCLATYIPWLLHEPQEGNFTFGETAEWLDLEGFFQAASEMGLYVIARPGPYQYSELIYDGLPGWLCENYPELLAKNFAGNSFRKSSVSYVHPLFWEKTRHWFNVVCPIIARYTIANGGPVSFVQLDNEMIGIHEWFGSLDYNKESMGFGKGDGRYTLFLEKRYGSLQALNQAYDSSFADFEQVMPPDPEMKETPEIIRQKKDYRDFYLGTIAEYASFLADLMRSHGIDSPLIHNSANPGMNLDFLETINCLKQKPGSQFLLGSDHYYNLDQTWGQNNPTPQYAARVFVSNETLRLMGFPPTVLEMPGGSLSDWPPITANDAKAAYLTNLAYGMKGHNYYVFTGGPNPPRSGNTTDTYDYSASISATGEIRPLFYAQKEFGDFLAQRPWFVTSERQFDLRFAIDFEQHRSSHYWKSRAGFDYSGPEAWNFFIKGPLSTAFCAGVSPKLVNLADSDWTTDLSTPVVVITASSMAEHKQKNIIEFVKNGGKVLLIPVLPVVDEQLKPCRILAEFLGSPSQQASPHYIVRPVFEGVKNIYHGEVYFFDSLPEKSRVLGYDEMTQKVLCWEKSFPGGGLVQLLGLTWMHGKREHEFMLVNLLKRIGLNQLISCSTPNVWATLWKAREGSVLFLLNLFTSETKVMVSFNLDGHHYCEEHSLKPVSVATVDLQ